MEYVSLSTGRISWAPNKEDDQALQFSRKRGCGDISRQREEQMETLGAGEEQSACSRVQGGYPVSELRVAGCEIE